MTITYQATESYQACGRRREAMKAMKMRRPEGGDKREVNVDLRKTSSMLMKSSSRTFSQGLAMLVADNIKVAVQMHTAMLHLRINRNRDLTLIHLGAKTLKIREKMLNFTAKMFT